MYMKKSTLETLKKKGKKFGIFVFEHSDRIEFLSVRTGKSLVLWFEDSLEWTSFGNKRKWPCGAFQALREAVAVDSISGVTA